MNAPAGTARLLTVEKAASRAGCHPETIRRAIRSKELKATRNRLAPGQPLLVDEDELRAFIEARTGPAN